MSLIIIILVSLSTFLLLLALEGIGFDLYLNIAEIGDLINHAILDCLVLIDELGEWNGSEQAWTGELEESCNWDNHGTGDDAGTPLASAKSNSTGKEVQVLDHEELEAGNKTEREPEVEIELAEDLLENVDLLLTDLSAVEVIEDLREDEGAEYVGEQLQFHLSSPVFLALFGTRRIFLFDRGNLKEIITASIWILGLEFVTVVAEVFETANIFSKHVENYNDDEVPQRHTKNLSPNWSGQNGGTGSWWRLQDFFHWWLS